jgi:hypothetical protein
MAAQPMTLDTFRNCSIKDYFSWRISASVIAFIHSIILLVVELLQLKHLLTRKIIPPPACFFTLCPCVHCVYELNFLTADFFFRVRKGKSIFIEFLFLIRGTLDSNHPVFVIFGKLKKKCHGSYCKLT